MRCCCVVVTRLLLIVDSIALLLIRAGGTMADSIALTMGATALLAGFLPSLFDLTLIISIPGIS